MKMKVIAMFVAAAGSMMLGGCGLTVLPVGLPTVSDGNENVQTSEVITPADIASQVLDKIEDINYVESDAVYEYINGDSGYDKELWTETKHTVDFDNNLMKIERTDHNPLSGNHSTGCYIYDFENKRIYQKDMSPEGWSTGDLPETAIQSNYDMGAKILKQVQEKNVRTTLEANGNVIDGKPVYKMTVDLDAATFLEFINVAMGEFILPEEYEEAGLSDKTIELEINVYKDSMLPATISVYQPVHIVAPVIYPSYEPDEEEKNMIFHISESFKNYNEAVNIEIPSNARSY